MLKIDQSLCLFPVPHLLMPFLFVVGIFGWTFTEYALHRWLFHRDPPTSSYFLITLHFLLHGQHHKVSVVNVLAINVLVGTRIEVCYSTCRVKALQEKKLPTVFTFAFFSQNRRCWLNIRCVLTVSP